MSTGTLGFAFCGSFCTYSKVMTALEECTRHFPAVIPIFSKESASTDTRFGEAATHLRRAEAICGRAAITTIAEAEPIGPEKLLNILLIAPCTGNTLAKLAHGIADTPVTMAAKSHLRNGRPVVIAVSSNDGLAAAAENIGRLLRAKHYYFVPFRQDSPEKKPTSLVADFSLVVPTLEAALEHRQLQPLILGPVQS